MSNILRKIRRQMARDVGPEMRLDPRRCPDCGSPGHGIGDMGCPSPQDHDKDGGIDDGRPPEDTDLGMIEGA